MGMAKTVITSTLVAVVERMATFDATFDAYRQIYGEGIRYKSCTSSWKQTLFYHSVASMHLTCKVGHPSGRWIALYRSVIRVGKFVGKSERILSKDK